MAEDQLEIHRRRLRTRSAVHSWDFEALGHGWRAIKRDFVHPKPLMDFVGVHGGRLRHKKDTQPFCTEPSLYGQFEVISDVCIMTPHPFTSFAPDERFMVQCMGFYPLGSIAMLGTSTIQAIQKHLPNVLYILECTRQGWRRRDDLSEGDDPKAYLRICHEAKARGSQSSNMLSGARIGKLLNDASHIIKLEDVWDMVPRRTK
eukprot:Gregarina_sp_Poly_1__1793@NODE_1465_length_4068_cov_574_937766_g969_i0_p2_GENE_NODE_1465_length_4068_cov_574_937766_g969_i0NODE_1465_length_4068_cov_574_937766_g969_i0_p2_ORF_typecomplete_len203_score18_91_NODE_1465_length_4068_cov_574_937766_g969_i026993307